MSLTSLLEIRNTGLIIRLFSDLSQVQPKAEMRAPSAECPVEMFARVVPIPSRASNLRFFSYKSKINSIFAYWKLELVQLSADSRLSIVSQNRLFGIAFQKLTADFFFFLSLLQRHARNEKPFKQTQGNYAFTIEKSR